jgi:hypothetical protein
MQRGVCLAAIRRGDGTKSEKESAMCSNSPSPRKAGKRERPRFSEGEDLSQRRCARQFRRIAGLIFLLACIGGAQDVNHASSTKQQARIAFAYSQDIKKHIDIFEANADGSGLVQLTHDSDVYSRANCCPAWSHDGAYLAFISRDPWPTFNVTHSGVYIINPSTGETRTVLRENIMCLADPA